MQFLTEDEAKKRCVSNEIHLDANERLTPAAHEMLLAQGCRIVSASPTNTASACKGSCSESASSCGCATSKEAPTPSEKTPETTPPSYGALPQGTTYLDAETIVNKSHPRIMLRGKLDSLIAACVVVQTQFDMRKSLPELVITGLADINTCLWYLLQTEITAAPLPAVRVCDMDADTLRTVSLNPNHYLGVDHIVPSGSLGPNVALLNWLRTITREVEVVCTEVSPERVDMLEGLNRLSTAVYVLMLLVVLAESGKSMPTATS